MTEIKPCPRADLPMPMSKGYVERLRAKLLAAEDRIIELEGLLRRLGKWDHLEAAGDGAYWRREIAEALHSDRDGGNDNAV